MRRPGLKWIMLGLVSALCITVTACASSAKGGAIPVDQLPDDPANTSAEYTIAPGDMISIQVFSDDKMSTKMRVRTDGRISMPLINEIDAAGKTPAKLGTDIEAKLKDLLQDPRVNVVVDESRPLTVSVLGEVSKPGTQTLERGAGVAEALAAAGGLSPFAHKDRIYVLRPGPPAQRIQFTYDNLIRPTGKAPLFRLKPGDMLVVE